jgi:hypothetical protein
MRVGILVVGIVLAIIGAVLLFVPVVPQASQTTTSTVPVVLLSVSGFSITGSIPVAVSWNSTTSVIVVGVACTATCNQNVSSLSGVTLQTGTSGSFTLNQPNGGEIGLAAENSSGSGSPSTVTFKVTTAISTVGSALLIVGIIVLIIGAAVKSKKAQVAAPAPMPYMPSTPAPPTMEPPAYPPVSPPSPPMGPS